MAPLYTPLPLTVQLCVAKASTRGRGWDLTRATTLFCPVVNCCNTLSLPSDNVDDPTGNFRSGPLTGWRVFLLLLCALLGIIVCAVVGAVVFQKRQERNKRFY